MKKYDVVIVMGSESDYPVMKKSQKLLKKWGVSTNTQIISAHRTPQLLEKSVKVWEKLNVKVIIAGAGGSAHLPGMLAAFSVLPVIGVPISTKNFNGLDSLLSIVQMPTGVPVATVAVGGAENAAILAAEIIALSNKKINTKLVNYKKQLKVKVKQMQIRLKKR